MIMSCDGVTDDPLIQRGVRSGPARSRVQAAHPTVKRRTAPPCARVPIERTQIGLGRSMWMRHAAPPQGSPSPNRRGKRARSIESRCVRAPFCYAASRRTRQRGDSSVLFDRARHFAAGSGVTPGALRRALVSRPALRGGLWCRARRSAAGSGVTPGAPQRALE